MSLQGSQMEADDPTTSYMLQVGVIMIQSTFMAMFLNFKLLLIVPFSSLFVGMGQTMQVLRTGLPPLHERCYASFASVRSTQT